MNDQPTPPAPENSISSTLPSQRAVYQKYLALQAIMAQQEEARWKGFLIVGMGMERKGAELAIAAMIAGATFLGIDSNPQLLKLAQRHHACDFAVNSLDEALRVLKNAIRKRQPVAVGLLNNAAEILPRMVERGVQPDFLSDTTHNEATLALVSAKACLAERGAILLNFESELEAVEFPHRNRLWVHWTAAGFQDMQRMDTLALSLLPIADASRRHWLKSAAAYFYRQLPLERVCTLSAEEIAALLSALKDPTWRAELRSPITLHWLDAECSSQTLCVEPKKSPSAS